MKTIVGIVVVALATVGLVQAQDAKGPVAEKSTLAGAAPEGVSGTGEYGTLAGTYRATAPEVPASIRQDLSALQVQIAGLAHAQQVLQKELDATTAQFQRAVQQAQAVCAAAPGYELAQTLTCEKKPEPKKTEPKKDAPPK